MERHKFLCGQFYYIISSTRFCSKVLKDWKIAKRLLALTFLNVHILFCLGWRYWWHPFLWKDIYLTESNHFIGFLQTKIHNGHIINYVTVNLWSCEKSNKKNIVEVNGKDKEDLWWCYGSAKKGRDKSPIPGEMAIAFSSSSSSSSSLTSSSS